MRSLLQSILVVLGLFLASSAAHADSLVFQVFKGGKGTPIKRAEIKIGTLIKYTDGSGKVEVTLDGLNFPLLVEVSRVGFVSQELNYPARPKDRSISIYLEPSVGGDDDVVIYGRGGREPSKKELSIREAREVAPAGDAVQSVRLLPGVQLNRGFDSRLVVRGSGPDDSLYYYNQIELPFVFHPIGSQSLTGDRPLDSISFSSGGYQVRYGNATGGVIGLQSKKQSPSEALTELKVNIPIYSSLYHERPLGEDSGLFATVRRSTLEAILPTVLDQAESDLTVTPVFGDAYVEYFSRHSQGVDRLTYLGSLDGLQAVFPFDQSNNEDGDASFFLRRTFHVFAYNKEHKFRNHWRLEATPHLLMFNQNTKILDNRINIKSTTLALPLELSHRRGKLIDSWGLDIRSSFYDLDLYVPKPTRDRPFEDFEEAKRLERDLKSRDYQASAWFSHDIDLEGLILTPGLRWDYRQSINKSSLDPRLIGRYKTGKDSQIKFSWGQYSKAPEVDESDEIFGNQDLTYERSIHSIFGWETVINERWNLDIQAFHKKFFAVVRSASEKNYANTGKASAYGFEFFIRKLLSERWFAWLSYTWSRSFEQESEQATVIPGSYDQRHVLSLASDYRLTGRWSLSGRIQYGSGSVYTPVNKTVYQANLDKYQPRIDPDEINSAYLPASGRVSIAASRKFYYKRWTLNLKFGVEEWIVGTKVQDVSWNYDYSQERYMAPVPLLPFLELRAVF